MSKSVPISEKAQIGAIAELVSAIGSPLFFSRALDLMRITAPLDGAAVLKLFRSQRPQVCLSDRATDIASWEAYTSGPYLFDPVHQLFMEGGPSGLYQLKKIAPTDFMTSDFFKNFIANHDYRDELDQMILVSGGDAFLLMLSRSGQSAEFQPEDIASLERISGIVRSAFERHAEITKSGLSDSNSNDAIQQKIDFTLARFGTSLLTPREQAVLRLLLNGYSSAQIAVRLEIAEGTVKIFRKAIHAKLDVSTQAELFSLFICSLAYADPAGEDDPLNIYSSARTGRSELR